MNYFDSEQVAERYSEGRPYFHFNTVQRIKGFLGFQHQLSRVLDVGCGTGLSTRALLPIAYEVYGTDTSAYMLKQAVMKEDIEYMVAPAENLPFPNQHFELITVGSAAHWFDIDKFLPEARRVLKPHHWLVLYENLFIAEMDEYPDFQEWFRLEYLFKFPAPPRNNKFSWEAENVSGRGFTLLKEDTYRNPVVFTRDSLILYFTTQTNIISPELEGSISLEEARQWLTEQLKPFFPEADTMRTIHFLNWIKYLKKE